MGIKQGHLQHLQIGEAIPTGLHYGQIPQPLPRNPQGSVMEKSPNPFLGAHHAGELL